MKRLAAALLLTVAMLIPSSGATQEDPLNQIIDWISVTSSYSCGLENPLLYHETLVSIFEETPLFHGRTRVLLYNAQINEFVPVEGILGFYVNQDTGTFSVAVFFQDGSYCDILTGVEFEPYTN
jgi:hypothetical protein